MPIHLEVSPFESCVVFHTGYRLCNIYIYNILGEISIKSYFSIPVFFFLLLKTTLQKSPYLSLSLCVHLLSISIGYTARSGIAVLMLMHT